jgi:uncharacterized protein (DUF362 family)
MPKSKVALVKCNSYDYDEVKFAVERIISYWRAGAICQVWGENSAETQFAFGRSAGKVCTTHPAVFKAVAEVFKSFGGEITYGDSPAFQKPKTVALKAGIATAANETGVSPADFATGEEVVFSRGLQNKKILSRAWNLSFVLILAGLAREYALPVRALNPAMRAFLHI